MIDIIKLVVTAFIAFSAVWVYFDATKKNIGKIPDEKGLFNMSAGAWSIVTFLLWIIAFPSYLIKRKSLLQKAKEKPVRVTGRSGKLVALSLLAILKLVLSSAGTLTDESATNGLTDKLSVMELGIYTSMVVNTVERCGSMTSGAEPVEYIKCTSRILTVLDSTPKDQLSPGVESALAYLHSEAAIAKHQTGKYDLSDKAYKKQISIIKTYLNDAISAVKKHAHPTVSTSKMLVDQLSSLGVSFDDTGCEESCNILSEEELLAGANHLLSGMTGDDLNAYSNMVAKIVKKCSVIEEPGNDEKYVQCIIPTFQNIKLLQQLDPRKSRERFIQYLLLSAKLAHHYSGKKLMDAYTRDTKQRELEIYGKLATYHWSSAEGYSLR